MLSHLSAALNAVFIMLSAFRWAVADWDRATEAIVEKFEAFPATNPPWAFGVFESSPKFHLPLYIYKNLEEPQNGGGFHFQ